MRKERTRRVGLPKIVLSPMSVHCITNTIPSPPDLEKPQKPHYAKLLKARGRRGSNFKAAATQDLLQTPSD